MIELAVIGGGPAGLTAALYAAGTEAQNLAVLSLITLVLCIAGAGVTTAALAQKKKKGA